jgi:predicted dehydrogenase
MSRLKVALLGCGGIAKRHADSALMISKDMKLVAGCGRDLSRTEAFTAQYPGMTPYDNLDRMLDEVAPDLVIATLPPFSRGGEIERVAARGVHLLIEKPIALDMEAADRMVESVTASGVTAAIGFMYRFGDAIRQWHQQDTGKVGLYAGTYHCNALHADWWRIDVKSGGQIVEQVIHQIDLIRHFMGDPDTVYARRANLFHGSVPGYDVEDVSTIVFGWDDGRIATLNASNIATPGVWHKDWNVFAERVTGRFTGWNDAVFMPTVAGGAAIELAGGTDPFVAQLVDVASAIRDRREPYVPLSEGAATLRLALAARRSADERREIRLNDV